MDDDNLIVLKESILKQLDDFNNGISWVTNKSGREVFSISALAAFKKVENHSHSVAEQLAHIIAWRNFAVQKLTGNDDFDIEDNTAADWPEPREWNDLEHAYEKCHQDLFSAIKNFPLEKWHSIVPLRNYTFLYLIYGIIEHDYYHFGQINSLLAAIARTEQR